MFKSFFIEIIPNLGTKVDERYLCNTSSIFPAGNYMFKVNNRNTRTRCEICSKLTIRHQNDVLNFE